MKGKPFLHQSGAEYCPGAGQNSAFGGLRCGAPERYQRAGCKAGKGLTEYLSGAINNVSDIIYNTNIDNFKFIPAGNPMNFHPSCWPLKNEQADSGVGHPLLGSSCDF